MLRKKVTVLWDYDNIQIPRLIHPAKVVAALTEIGHQFGDTVTITVFTNTDNINLEVFRQLSDTGVAVRPILSSKLDNREAVDKAMIASMSFHDYQPGDTVIVISNDGDFSPSMSRLHQHSCKVILIHTNSGADNHINNPQWEKTIIWSQVMQSLSYEFCLMTDERIKLELNKLYLRKVGQHIEYTNITPSGTVVCHKLDVPLAPEPFTLEMLNKMKLKILKAAAKKGHVSVVLKSCSHFNRNFCEREYRLALISDEPLTEKRIIQHKYTPTHLHYRFRGPDDKLKEGDIPIDKFPPDFPKEDKAIADNKACLRIIQQLMYANNEDHDTTSDCKFTHVCSICGSPEHGSFICPTRLDYEKLAFKVCQYHNRPQGCKFGDKCRHRHAAPDPLPAGSPSRPGDTKATQPGYSMPATQHPASPIPSKNPRSTAERKDRFATYVAILANQPQRPASTTLFSMRPAQPAATPIPSAEPNRSVREDWRVPLLTPQVNAPKIMPQCPERFFCKNGLACQKYHTSFEYEVFNNNGGKGPDRFRTEMCRHGETCRRKGIGCMYAHSDEEAICIYCATTGHILKNCCNRPRPDTQPKPRQKMQIRSPQTLLTIPTVAVPVSQQTATRTDQPNQLEEKQKRSLQVKSDVISTIVLPGPQQAVPRLQIVDQKDHKAIKAWNKDEIINIIKTNWDGYISLIGYDIGTNDISDLIEVLKHNKALIALDLSNTSLSDTNAMALAMSLPDLAGLRELNLTNNQITDLGATVLAQAIANNKTLEILHLANNKISCQGAIALSTALKRNKSLVSLHLESDDKQVQAVLADIQKTIAESKKERFENKNLTQILQLITCGSYFFEVDLSHLNLNEVEIISVFAALYDNRPITKKLILDNHNLSKIAANNLIPFLKEARPRTLIELSLKNTQLDDDIGQKILSALPHNQNIKHIDLSGNKISAPLLERIAALLASRNLQQQSLAVPLAVPPPGLQLLPPPGFGDRPKGIENMIFFRP